MKIALGSDHRGADSARRLADHLEHAGHEVLPLAICDRSPQDYPDQAYLVGRVVGEGTADRGILLCGSGIGMSMAANKVTGVRAALVHDEIGADMSRRHNDANVLCLSADHNEFERLARLTDRWLASPFEGGRHARRVRKITAIEQGRDPATVS